MKGLGLPDGCKNNTLLTQSNFFFYAKKVEALMPNNRFKILAQRSLNAGVKQNALVLYLRLLFA